jgi:MerR family glutamine synthetase transcriptional repressor
MNNDIRRNMALFPIGIVMKLTELSARQIRYYEQHGLISPMRTQGNKRMFSFNDVDRLLEIKSLLDKGMNLAGIKKVMQTGSAADEIRYKKLVSTEDSAEAKGAELTDTDVHRLLKLQLISERRPDQVSIIRGELSRFYQ